MTITLTSTNPKAELASSLSGNLADYWLEASAPGKIILTAINSYKKRFRKTKAELKEVVEEERKLEENRETLQHAQAYTKISAGKPPAAHTHPNSPKSLNRATQSVVATAAQTCNAGFYASWEDW
jgi:hypothetical protein